MLCTPTSNYIYQAQGGGLSNAARRKSHTDKTKTRTRGARGVRVIVLHLSRWKPITSLNKILLAFYALWEIPPYHKKKTKTMMCYLKCTNSHQCPLIVWMGVCGVISLVSTFHIIIYYLFRNPSWLTNRTQIERCSSRLIISGLKDCLHHKLPS